MRCVGLGFYPRVCLLFLKFIHVSINKKDLVTKYSVFLIIEKKNTFSNLQLIYLVLPAAVAESVKRRPPHVEDREFSSQSNQTGGLSN